MKIYNNEIVEYDELLDEPLDEESIADILGAGPEVFCDYDARRSSCSFTGHRVISQEKVHELIPKLKSTVLYLISKGVTEFHTGGADGFDTIAAGVVHEAAMTHKHVRLVLELPYEKSFAHLKKNAQEKRFYEFIKSVADEVNVHGQKPVSKLEAVKSLYKRNRVLMDKSYYCVCYMQEETGGTAYTVNYAKNLDCNIINLAKD
ncbi:MAG: DUF1273 family protein [Clostridia bacterium]|nr:DUF1273 family protein [Clostridia bacterium]